MIANKRKRGGRRRGTGILPHITTMPSAKRVLMTYTTSPGFLQESAAGSGASYFFRLNSVFDPDYTGVGNTAGGYSTWAALFLNYKVQRVTARVRGTYSGSAGSFGIVVVAPVAYQAVVPADPALWRTIPYSREYEVMNATEGGKNYFTHVQSYRNDQVARVTKQQYDIDMDFSGQVGSNPVRQNFLMVSLQGAGTTSAAKLTFFVDITYEVEWFNPVPMQR